MKNRHSFTRKPSATELADGAGLKIPVFDLSLSDGKTKGRYQAEPEVLRNSMLELLFEPEELKSLVIVKPDPDDTREDPLKSVDFGDDIPRRVTFSSGKNVYFAAQELSAKLLSIFATQPDHACRYGSLLVSSCTQGAQLLDSSEDNQTLKVKIVDSQSDNFKEIALAKTWQTGDCHGKISPALAQQLGATHNRPFQFRMAWLNEWSREDCRTPEISFLAKGTLLPDAELTDNSGYDIILDRSSIKGVDKKQLADLIPCGDYELPQAVLGNRGNAKVTEYENSWQFSIWYSEDAIQADIVPATQAAAQNLASLQKNCIQLAKFLVEQHDKKAAFRQTADDTETEFNELGNDQTKRHESRLISILRNDKLGQLLDFPKVVDFMQEQLAKKWKDLAIKGAIHHGSAMAQPCEDLLPGTIIAPHLRHGTEVIVTRYPIVSKDNIRRYTVNNKQKPEFTRYKGCVFIRPDQAMQHHQCDFDGDQLVVTPASRLPHIAQETRFANEEHEYEAIEKRPKVDYTQATDTEGKRKYTKLRQIAVAIAKNKIGWVATLIGRVQSSAPEPGQPEALFNQRKQKLLGQLFDALQIEVDSPKSATRLEDYHPTLLEAAKKWSQQHPCYLFDFKDDSRLYKSVPLPTEDSTAISAIAKVAVNPAWEPTRLKSRHRDEFRYLFSPPSDLDERETWEKHYLSWAQDVKERYRERMGEIYQLHGDNPTNLKEAVSKLYESLRSDVAEAFPNSQERFLAASAMWHLETTNPNLDVPRKAGKELSRQLEIEFHLESDYQQLHSALPKDTYILSVPFEEFIRDDSSKIVRDKQRKPLGQDLAGQWKERLDSKNIEYEATLHPSLPMVNFALLDPSNRLIEALEKRYGNNTNDIDSLNLTYRDGLGRTQDISSRIVAPTEYTWLESQHQTPKAALVLNLFTDEICQQLQNFRFDRAELIGQKHNAFKDVDFSRQEWSGQKFAFEVGSFSSSDLRYDGSPIVLLDGKPLAMFSANSPKLPIGTIFEATIEPSSKGNSLLLSIDSKSVQFSHTVEPQIEDEVIAKKVRSPHQSQRNSQLKNKIDRPDSLEVSQLLKEVIYRFYEQTGETEFAIGDWSVKIKEVRNNLRCWVKDEDDTPVFAADLKTGSIVKELSSSNCEKFMAQVLDITPEQAKKEVAEAQI
ncbi:MAG: hypothetical protein F6K32_15160 [Desertifilum sp. SIO1I2]|nr:hypothetical protein [Desertifilum sp. SIO1I2]